MDPSVPPNEQSRAGNGPPNATAGAGSMSASTPQSTTPMPPAWSSQMSTFPANNGGAGSPGFPQYSASTAAILQRLQEKGGHATGSAAFEAKKAEILQNYATSDKLPTPPPAPINARRGRGGRVSTPSGLKTEVGTSPAGASSGRGSGRGRGRGRGGRGGRGGKRKRNESDEESEVGLQNMNWDYSHSLTEYRLVTIPTSQIPTHHYPRGQSLDEA